MDLLNYLFDYRDECIIIVRMILSIQVQEPVALLNQMNLVIAHEVLGDNLYINPKCPMVVVTCSKKNVKMSPT